MKTLLLALALISVAPLAHAQIVIQAPPIPGMRPPGPPPGDHDEYWRHHGDEDWRRRAEFNEEQHRHEEWVRAHCVRNWQGEEYCRR